MTVELSDPQRRDAMRDLWQFYEGYTASSALTGAYRLGHIDSIASAIE